MNMKLAIFLGCVVAGLFTMFIFLCPHTTEKLTYVPFISRYVSLEVPANQTRCIPLNDIVLEPRHTSITNYPLVVYGNRSKIDYFLYDNKTLLCAINNDESPALIWFYNKDYENLIYNSSCSVWYSVEHKKTENYTESFLYCIAHKLDNQTLEGLCIKSCEEYNLTQEQDCVVACLRALSQVNA